MASFITQLITQSAHKSDESCADYIKNVLCKLHKLAIIAERDYMSVSRYEQETTITLNEEEGTASIFSASPVWMRKLDKLCAEHPGECAATEESVLHGEVVGRFYTVPKKYIKISPPKKMPERTEEQKAAARERLLKARADRRGTS